jgi:hypothetical protein
VWKPAALALLLTAAVPVRAGAPFTAPLPDGLPSLQTWERIAGDAVVDDPALHVEYEFYVNPERPALYELIRYRVSRADGTITDQHPGLEKLQWQAGERDFRRFECFPAPGSVGCRWRRMRQGSDEFTREVSVILWLYGVHRRLLDQEP